MDISAIASASINMHLAQTQQAVGVSMLKKTMDMQQASSDTLIQSMSTATSSSGHQLDLLV